MVTVAVAGGTGGIGRTIVDELVQQGKHHVLILSRKAVTIPELSIPIIAANYEDQSDLRELLQKNNVDVVISTLSLFDEASATAQTNLIHAAIDSGTVTRFIPSEYGADYTTPGLAEAHPAAKWFNDAADLLRTSRLDFTRFIFGQLTDHYGFPKAPSHMKQFTYFWDFTNKKAAIPGDGEAHATFLHSTDVAKYTAALLDEKKKWPEMSAFASDRMTWNALLRLAETITGVKWDVTHDSLDDLHKGKATYLSQPTGPRSYNLPPEAGQQMAAEFGILAAEGILGLPQHVLRNSEFPQIKPRTVEELITQAWGTEG